MAAITSTFTFLVTPLSDGEIWFANSAAWNSYWANIQATVSIDAATTTTYGVSKQANNKVYVEVVTYYTLNVDLDGDGVPETYDIPTKAAFDTLNSIVKDMRTAMKNAGLLKEAQ